MIEVSDSTPLIHFAKVEHIELLFSLYKEIIITKEVYREVVEEGNILEKEDARIIQKYIGKSIGVLFDALKIKLIDAEQAISILNKFREKPQIFWIEPNIIKSAIEKIYNNKL